MDNQIIKYNGNQLQKVKDAIRITNKLLNIDFSKIEVAHLEDPNQDEEVTLNQSMKTLHNRVLKEIKTLYERRKSDS